MGPRERLLLFPRWSSHPFADALTMDPVSNSAMSRLSVIGLAASMIVAGGLGVIYVATVPIATNPSGTAI